MWPHPESFLRPSKPNPPTSTTTQDLHQVQTLSTPVYQAQSLPPLDTTYDTPDPHTRLQLDQLRVNLTREYLDRLIETWTTLPPITTILVDTRPNHLPIYNPPSNHTAINTYLDPQRPGNPSLVLSLVDARHPTFHPLEKIAGMALLMYGVLLPILGLLHLHGQFHMPALLTIDPTPILGYSSWPIRPSTSTPRQTTPRQATPTPVSLSTKPPTEHLTDAREKCPVKSDSDTNIPPYL